MASSKDRQNALKRLRTFLYQPKSDIASYRAKIEEEFSEIFLPNRVDMEERKFGDVKCDVLYPEMYAKNRLMLYIHGGSFIGGSRKSYRSFVASLAHACSCKAVLPEFRLAPAFPFPFSVNDIQSVFRAVVALEFSHSSDDEKIEIILAADTSGASLALGFILNLKPKYRSFFSKIVLFSPWLDISKTSSILKSKKACDEVFTAESVRVCAENYVSEEKRDDPLVSPLLAKKEQLESFPPVFIQMGEKEMFMEDAERFEALCADAKVPCTLDIWDGMMPLFQLADEFIVESHLAVEKLGKIIKQKSEEK